MVISLFGLVFSFSRIATYTHRPQVSKFTLIIVGIYMSSTIYYYYTKGEKSDADE